MSKVNRYIILPFWRPVVDDAMLLTPCDDNLNYQLFCFHSRFDDYARFIYDKDVAIITRSIYDHIENRFNFIVELKDENDFVIEIKEDELNKFKSKIAEITTKYPNHALINISSLINTIKSKNQIPETWLRHMSSFIQIPEEYQPFVRDDGFYVDVQTEDEYTYIQDGPDMFLTYETKYLNLMDDILKQYTEFYHQGTGLFFGIAGEWELTGDLNLSPYYANPTWSMPQLTHNDSLNFMNQIVTGKYRYSIDDYLNNDVYRHLVARELSDLTLFSFDSSDIIFYFQNLDEANKAILKLNSLIDTIVSKSFTVVRFNLTDEKWKDIFDMILSEFSDDIVSYSVEDPQRPFSISVLLDYILNNSDDFKKDVWSRANILIDKMEKKNISQ